MPAAPDSAGEIMLKLAACVDRFKLDNGIENMLRTSMAPEDVLAVLTDPNLKLDNARNPSSLLMNYAKPHIRRAKADNLVSVVPLLKWIDKVRDTWSLDAEAEALLKFMVPCAYLVPWLEQIGEEVPGSDDPNTTVKARIKQMLLETPPRNDQHVGADSPEETRGRGGRDGDSRSQGANRRASRSRSRSISRGASRPGGSRRRSRSDTPERRQRQPAADIAMGGGGGIGGTWNPAPSSRVGGGRPNVDSVKVVGAASPVGLGSNGNGGGNTSKSNPADLLAQIERMQQELASVKAAAGSVI
eukprot:TRINITY_DN62797_c0_g1_i1.p1 TRINITY_DN62797_c0_g1~~TRINITY_DN62797_c0_g1_i1.p1  ORF type:complete len:301 (+),score=47.62 TRINITY_DN62797_c0_g1_i1:80-982(+)